MTMEIVAQILGRALMDEAFRGQLLNAPDQVLGEFDLSVQEVEALKQLNADQFQQLNEAFQAQLGGAEADLAQASNFLKIEGIDGSISLDHKNWFLKWGSVEGGGSENIPGRLKWLPEQDANFENAWPSKVVPSTPTAATGLSFTSILAIGAVVVVALGAVAAGIFFFRSDETPEELGIGSQPTAQATPAPPQDDAPVFQEVMFESSKDSLCLNGENFHMCAIPAGQVADQIGDNSDRPLMLPLTPEQASQLVSISGGSPPGVTGFTVMMLAGPDTYHIQLPDSSTGKELVFLSDAQGNLYLGSAAYFPSDINSAETGGTEVDTLNTFSGLAGTWESTSGAGKMTCEGVAITIPSAEVSQIVFDENGQAVLSEIEADSSTVQITTSSEGTFLATVTTVVEGETVIGELEFTLISPDVIEGIYRASYEDICSFERPVTMKRISDGGAASQDNFAPLKPAEFIVESYFNSGEVFIPQLEMCSAFPDVCMEGMTSSESLDALLSGWGTFGGDVFMHTGGGGAGKVNISNNCETGLSGTACVTGNDQGDAYIPPYPADAGWGSKGVGNPTLVSVLDVDALSVINGIFDLWLVMGVPQTGDWDGFISLNGDLIQVYELDLATGQQSLWEEIKVTYDAVEITTDQNRLFVVYLFEDETAAQEAPVVVP